MPHVQGAAVGFQDRVYVRYFAGSPGTYLDYFPSIDL